MTDNSRDVNYEQLYTQLLERGEMLHENNKKRIRLGLIFLVILPFILGLILWITGSSKIVFLIIWILCMFAICAYLISVEYIDDSIQKTLEDVTDREADFGGLLPRASAEELQERIKARIAERRAQRADTESSQAKPDADLSPAEDDDTEPVPETEDTEPVLDADELLEAIMAADLTGKEDEK